MLLVPVGLFEVRFEPGRQADGAARRTVEREDAEFQVSPQEEVPGFGAGEGQLSEGVPFQVPAQPAFRTGVGVQRVPADGGRLVQVGAGREVVE